MRIRAALVPASLGALVVAIIVGRTTPLVDAAVAARLLRIFVAHALGVGLLLLEILRDR